MCQITLANLHDEELNKMFFLLSGTTGSIVHDDGWGFVQCGAPFFKCKLPMHITSNSGSLLFDNSKKNKNTAPLLGHIRQASPKVPVTDENAHPFVIEDVVFVHNGKLIPLDEKKFVMEETVDDVDKDKKPIKVTVGRSDSLIFFEHFMKIYEANTEKNTEKRFIESVTEAMKDFSGKFAMVFLIGDTYYIARGKTADLYISYLMEGETKKGFVVNTDKGVLSHSTNLLSNIHQLIRGDDGLDFTYPVILDAESLFVVEDFGLRKLGPIVEKPAPVVTTTYPKWEGAGNFTGKGATSGTDITGKSTLKSPVEKYAEKVYKFMTEWSLSLYDINHLLMICYRLSATEIDERIAKHFCDVVIPLLKNATTKKIRKSFKAKLYTAFPGYRYSQNIQYPWMMNPKEKQTQLLEEVTKKN